MSGLFCTFGLAGQLFGVNVKDVKEVSTETGFTPVPHAPPEVRGYVNLRGQIHLVLDLRVLLGMGRAEATPDSRLVLFKPAVGDAFGVLVDHVGDIVQLAAGQLEPVPPADAAPAGEGTPRLVRGGEFIVGLGKLPGELLILLEPRRFLEAVERALAV
jgi:purine-binding chemotaxis protein CheW